ncbi:MAG: rane protein [Actinomycetia bacterium]|nr:rane protein [Actinomycetes bacterium]
MITATPQSAPPVIRPFRVLGRAVTGVLVEEWHKLTVLPGLRLRLGPRAFPLTLGSTALVMVMWLGQMTTAGSSAVVWIGGVSARLPIDVAVARFPGSMFAPAPNLPVWGSLAQVLLVFGLAEAWLGAGRTLGISLLATALSSLGGRLMCELGPHHLLGLPYQASLLLDTGPSSAVVALMVYVCLRQGAWLGLTATIIVMVGELVVLPNMAGREHIIAIVTALLAALPLLARDRQRHRVPLPVADFVRLSARCRA